MATKRGEKSNLLELRGRGGTIEEQPMVKRTFQRPSPYIERTVLTTDTLQGIALLYNTTVAEIKKLNQLQTDGELHARRVVKVPSRGILINLEPTPTVSQKAGETTSSSTIFSVASDDDDDGENSILESGIGLAYLNSKDSLLTEIKAKVDHVAANSPILNGHEHSDDLDVFSHIRIHSTRLDRRNESSLKWWHVLFPCLGFVILFPILLFIFQEHLHDLGHKHDGDVMNRSKSDFVVAVASEYMMPEVDH